MKIELKNLDEFKYLTHNKGILSNEYTFRDYEEHHKIEINIKNNVIKRKQRSLNIINKIKNKFKNGLTKTFVNKKVFSKNIIFFISLMSIEKMDFKDYSKFVNFVLTIKNIDKKVLIESLLNNFDNCSPESILKEEDFLNKLKILVKTINDYELESKDTIDYIFGIDFLAYLKLELFKKFENMLMEMINNNEISEQTATNFFYYTFHRLEKENLKRILNKSVMLPYSNYEYIFRIIKKTDKELSNIIINSCIKGNFNLTELYYVCLIKKIDNNIDLKDVNINSIMMKLMRTEHKLINVDLEKIFKLIKTYIEESINTKYYLKRLIQVADLFEAKKELKNKIKLFSEIENF